MHTRRITSGLRGTLFVAVGAVMLPGSAHAEPIRLSCTQQRRGGDYRQRRANHFEILTAAATKALAHSGVLDNSTISTICPFTRYRTRVGPRTASGMRVRFKAVIENSQLRESWHELNQIDTTPVVALSNVFFRNVVPASSHPRSNACDVQFRASQSYAPDAHVDSGRQGLLEKPGDGVPPERRLECEVEASGNRSFQQAFSRMPGGAVRFCSR